MRFLICNAQRDSAPLGFAPLIVRLALRHEDPRPGIAPGWYSGTPCGDMGEQRTAQHCIPRTISPRLDMPVPYSTNQLDSPSFTALDTSRHHGTHHDGSQHINTPSFTRRHLTMLVWTCPISTLPHAVRYITTPVNTFQGKTTPISTRPCLTLPITVRYRTLHRHRPLHFPTTRYPSNPHDARHPWTARHLAIPITSLHHHRSIQVCAVQPLTVRCITLLIRSAHDMPCLVIPLHRPLHGIVNTSRHSSPLHVSNHRSIPIGARRCWTLRPASCRASTPHRSLRAGTDRDPSRPNPSGLNESSHRPLLSHTVRNQSDQYAPNQHTTLHRSLLVPTGLSSSHHDNPFRHMPPHRSFLDPSLLDAPLQYDTPRDRSQHRTVLYGSGQYQTKRSLSVLYHSPHRSLRLGTSQRIPCQDSTTHHRTPHRPLPLKSSHVASSPNMSIPGSTAPISSSPYTAPFPSRRPSSSPDPSRQSPTLHRSRQIATALNASMLDCTRRCMSKLRTVRYGSIRCNTNLHYALQFATLHRSQPCTPRQGRTGPCAALRHASLHYKPSFVTLPDSATPCNTQHNQTSPYPHWTPHYTVRYHTALVTTDRPLAATNHRSALFFTSPDAPALLCTSPDASPLHGTLHRTEKGVGP